MRVTTDFASTHNDLHSRYECGESSDDEVVELDVDCWARYGPNGEYNCCCHKTVHPTSSGKEPSTAVI